MFTITNIQIFFLHCVLYNEHIKISKFRKLKIHSKYQARRWAYTTVPEIRLEGKWLDKLGFKKGDTVKVKMQDNKLTITLDKGQK